MIQRTRIFRAETVCWASLARSCFRRGAERTRWAHNKDKSNLLYQRSKTIHEEMKQSVYKLPVHVKSSRAFHSGRIAPAMMAAVCR